MAFLMQQSFLLIGSQKAQGLKHKDWARLLCQCWSYCCCSFLRRNQKMLTFCMKMRFFLLWPLAEQISKSDSYVANHQGLTERCFFKTNVVFSETTVVPQIISLSHQPMLCTTLFYLYARSLCLFQMHLSAGQQYQWQEGMAASTMTQTHWFQQSSHKPVLSGMHSKTEIPPATVVIPFWSRMWSLNVWRSFLSL